MNSIANQRLRSGATHSVTFLLALGCMSISAPLAHSQTPPVASATTKAVTEGSFSGKVVETMDAASYTYVLVDTGTNKLWAAAPQFAVKIGDAVAVAAAMPMPKYHSKTLNRDFDMVYFTGNVTVNGKSAGAGEKPAQLPSNHPPIGGAASKPTADFTKIKQADGGKRIADIFADKAKLKGKQVIVRGVVVKYNAEVMGKNWLHIQDGSGAAGSNDLTVTTAAKVKLGDTVLVTGSLSTDRDFGGGYRYTVIVEDAKVTVE